MLFILKFNDGSAGLEAMRSDVTARQYHWVPIKKRQALFGLPKNRQQPSVKRTRFSLTLSWGCTVYKVQGLPIVLHLLIIKYKHTSFSFG